MVGTTQNAADAVAKALEAIVDRNFTFFGGVMLGSTRKITRQEVLAGREALAAYRAAQPQQAEYPPLTPAEVHDLSCMQGGAPWMEPTLTGLGACIAIYERLRAEGRRPVDPADMPEAEREAYSAGQEGAR